MTNSHDFEFSFAILPVGDLVILAFWHIDARPPRRELFRDAGLDVVLDFIIVAQVALFQPVEIGGGHYLVKLLVEGFRISQRGRERERETECTKEVML